MLSQYPPPPEGVYTIPEHLLDLRPDPEIDQYITSTRPVHGEKNVWFFWHSGYASMHPYCRRNIRAWHRRLSKLGWEIRVMDRYPGSPCNIDQYLDISDTKLFPVAFNAGTLNGRYAMQHTSDLVRFPLLLTFGGVYADVGLLQIGDLDWLWNETVGNLSSPYNVLSYSSANSPNDPFELTNYFFCSEKANPLFARAHAVFLALWAEDGGKTNTEGMHASPYLHGIPPLEYPGSFTEQGRTYSPAEVTVMLTDYIIQGQALKAAMCTKDPTDGWDGPEYMRNKVYAIEYMVGSQLINEYTSWNGGLAYELMSLPLPGEGEAETEKQGKAREIVEGCMSQSFGFKLATGMIQRVMGPTLSSLWRDNVGSDNVDQTYAHWLRYGTVHWTQKELPPRVMWPDSHAPRECALPTYERKEYSL